MWIYVLGERSGADIKIGHTDSATINQRLNSVNGDQTTNAEYVTLAGCLGDLKDENCMHRYFAELRSKSKGRRKEYYQPGSELVEYATWLRRQYWTAATGDETQEEWAAVDSSHWLPDQTRRQSGPIPNPSQLIQDYVALDGPLAGTAWDWMPEPRASIQDFFTPVDLIDAARVGMGGIDLDAASHWLANRRHRIPEYFDINRSAFDNDWFGRVWLNPPYGNNGPWFERARRFLLSGDIEQLAILSPLWAFTTEIAKPLMEMATATVILVPTPKFWGNPRQRIGSNHPHGIVYFGSRAKEMLSALGPHGIPFRAAWPDVPVFEPQEDAA